MKKIIMDMALKGDIAIVTILGQEWLDFTGLNEYRFYKTPDVPKLYDDSADAVTEAIADYEMPGIKEYEYPAEFLHGG